MIMAKPMSLQDLLVIKLRALYDAELELVKALPKMAKGSADAELAQSFNDHLAETENHAKRLEEIFVFLDMKPARLKGDAIRGLVTDGAWVIKNVPEGSLRDINLCAAASYVEHYEMAGYLAALDWATSLGMSGVADILNMTLAEEMAANEKLTAKSKKLIM
jgi:ferritin-like metal-binding protein YciE